MPAVSWVLAALLVVALTGCSIYRSAAQSGADAMRVGVVVTVYRGAF
jgi:uncharacterized lipoprotein